MSVRDSGISKYHGRNDPMPQAGREEGTMKHERCECHECTQARAGMQNPFLNYIQESRRCPECIAKINNCTTPGSIIEVHEGCIR
jgi:hypothetical protein